jgi:hypothetical protein
LQRIAASTCPAAAERGVMQMAEQGQVAMPMAQAYPVATPQATQPQHTSAGWNVGSEHLDRVGPSPVDVWKRLGRGPKMCIAFTLVVTILVGGFFFVRTTLMGCGCPIESQEYAGGSNGGYETHCHCSGDVFSCTWNCEDGSCYSNGALDPICGGSVGPNTSTAR